MTKEQLNILLADWHRLTAAVADPCVLPGLPHEPQVLRAIPDPCRPFQARWILGNCGKIMLRNLRAKHPALVAVHEGDTIRYRKTEVLRIAGREIN